ncbi:HMR1 protein, partial [Polypterus senegalus]
MNMNNFCRVCGSALKGNQRRWIFGKQQHSFGSRSSLISADGTWSSSPSLESISSQSMSVFPAQKIDLLAVLTHVLGREIQRKDGRGEFLCSKCVSVLERIFKFDTVIARVRALSLENLQRLASEKENLSHWMAGLYNRRHQLKKSSSTSSVDSISNEAQDSYQEMLRCNMALSDFEWWSEKWDVCPHYRKTGKSCRNGKSCEGCNVLRVSDSDYESVCGIPRRLSHKVQNSSLPSPLPLSRDKSRSMPLDWLNPSVSGSSKAGRESRSSVGDSHQSLNCESLEAVSRTNSVISLDSSNILDSFEWPLSPGVTSPFLTEVLSKVKEIEYRPVSSPPHCRIPVRSNNRELKLRTPKSRSVSEAMDTEKCQEQTVNRALNFELEFDESKVEKADVFIEHHEFLPFSSATPAERQLLQVSVRQLIGQLEHAHAKIRSLDQKHSDETEQQSEEENVAEIKELKKQLNDLHASSTEKDKDLSNLALVLQKNQELFEALHSDLLQKDNALNEQLNILRRERESWMHRDSVITGLLKEKDQLLCTQQLALENSYRNVQALSDSVISQRVSGSETSALLASQLEEKEAILHQILEEQKDQEDAHWKQVKQLLTALENREKILQDQSARHAEALSGITQELREAHKKLRKYEKEIQKHEKKVNMWEREKRKLNFALRQTYQIFQQKSEVCIRRERRGVIEHTVKRAPTRREQTHGVPVRRQLVTRSAPLRLISMLPGHWLVLLWSFTEIERTDSDSHTLEFIFTAISSSEDLPEFMSAVILDGQQISYYDSKSRQISHKQTWMKQKMYQFNAHSSGVCLSVENLFKSKLQALVMRSNHSSGIHVLQRSLGCDVEDGVLKQGFLLYGYNGEDLIGFSKDRLQWFPAIPEAYFLKREWDKDRMSNKDYKDFLDSKCVEILKKHVENKKIQEVTPEMKAFSRKTKDGHRVHLTCLATGLNHQNIKSSWYKNGAPLRNKSQSAKILPNGDGTFQIRDTLEIDHADNNNYSCEVERSTVNFVSSGDRTREPERESGGSPSWEATDRDRDADRDRDRERERDRDKDRDRDSIGGFRNHDRDWDRDRDRGRRERERDRDRERDRERDRDQDRDREREQPFRRSDSFPDRRPPRKGNTLYVHGAGMSEESLRSAFSAHGNIIDLSMDSPRK